MYPFECLARVDQMHRNAQGMGIRDGEGYLSAVHLVELPRRLLASAAPSRPSHCVGHWPAIVFVAGALIVG